jgi:hypothetical protein
MKRTSLKNIKKNEDFSFKFSLKEFFRVHSALKSKYFRMSNYFFIVLLGLMVNSMASAQPNTGTIRGKLIEIQGNDTLSAPSIAITLLDSSTNVRTSPVYSSSDGMYTINSVEPKKYTLEIWNRGINERPLLYEINVRFGQNRYFDIDQIAIVR